MTSFVLALLLAAADPSGQGQASAANQPVSTTVATAKTPAKPDQDPNRVVCKAGENIGSRIQTRTCKTQAQWDAEEEAMRSFLRDAGGKGSLTDNTPTRTGL